ncbi:MAG: DUF433 domain-containing protein [Bryobacterales bacterium]|nr:DUF433 domain-containing protein [Bryobacterales bacterium]
MAEPRIISDPAVLGGKPCVRGTRISVEFILELFASGARIEEIIEAYPQLHREDVEAAVRLAAEYLRHDDVLELEIRH